MQTAWAFSYKLCCVSSPSWPEKMFFYLLCSTLYTPIFTVCTASRAWYLCEGGMTILIRGFESNLFSRRYTNLVELVVFASVNLSCFLTLYSCSTSSCTSSKTEVSIFFSSTLPVFKLNQDLPSVEHCLRFVLSLGLLDQLESYL